MKKDKEVKIIRSYSEALKLKVVSDVEEGIMTQAEAARHIGCHKASVWGWLKKYGKYDVKTKTVRIGMKSEEDRIKELESALAKAHMKLEVYEKMMDFAKEDYGIEVKKNSNTGELELVRNAAKSKSTAKPSE